MSFTDFANDLYSIYITGFADFFGFVVTSGIFAIVLPFIILDLALRGYRAIRHNSRR
jgi:hypothetical protein